MARAQLLGHVHRAELEGPRFQRITRAVYADVRLELGIAEKIAAFRVALPEGIVLVGLSAAWALGVPLAALADTVEVICPHRVRARQGLAVGYARLPPDEIVRTPAGPATSPARTAFDLARRAALPRPAAEELIDRLSERVLDLNSTRLGPVPVFPDALGFPVIRRLEGQRPQVVSLRLAVAVARVDALLRASRTPVSEVEALAARHVAARGVRTARIVARMADPRAESLPESVLRVRVVLSDLPVPEPQVKIRTSFGDVVARTDLGIHQFRLGAEYDGADHDQKERVRRDRARDNAAKRAGWELVHLDSSDLRRPIAMLQTVHAALRDRPT